MDSTYCSAVDTGLFVSVQGAVGLCCSGAEPLGNIRTESVDDIFKKEKFIAIQNNLRQNKSDDYCSGCDRADAVVPFSSQRSSFNEHFPSVGQRKLRLADIRWSNVCNLSCRYCNTHDSSEWRKLHNLPIESVDKDYVESLFKNIEDNKDTLSRLYLLGGEPLLQKHNERLLDIVDKNTKIDVITNLSVKLKNNKIYEKLRTFRDVIWNISFDNVGDRFEYVRHGADWKIFTDNIERLCDDFGSMRIGFHPVYTIWNATRLVEYYEFASIKNTRVNWQFALPKGDGLGLDTDSFIAFGHKPKIIELAINEIDKVPFKYPMLDDIKNSLIKDIEVAGRSKQFVEWTEKMEKFMPPKQSFNNLWPELSKVLNT